MLPTIHMVVKNEDRFVWYALSSVLPYASNILITDTGSTDKTAQVIKTFKTPNIIFREKKIFHPGDLSKIRQRQIEETKTDWIWIVDGDEIYPKSLCLEIMEIIKKKGNDLEGIVVGRYDLIGDLYHFQDEKVGTYRLFGKKGHIVLRLINRKNINRLHVDGIYPYEGYYDDEDIELIHHKPSFFEFTEGKLYHAMYLRRSTQGANLKTAFNRKKWKIEKGHKISSEDSMPEVFSQRHPFIVPDVRSKMPVSYEIASLIITPLKKLKRKF